jgi:hypothetical protein
MNQGKGVSLLPSDPPLLGPSDRLRVLLETGFCWNQAAEASGMCPWALRRWWCRKGAQICDPIDAELGHRLIRANRGLKSPALFDGLLICRGCSRRLKKPDQRDANGRPYRWACSSCRSEGRRAWVHAAAIKRAVFRALQQRLPEMARLCEYRTRFQRRREQEWLEKLEAFLAIGQQLHEAGLPRMAPQAMAARVRLAQDQLGDPPDMVRHNWGATFSSWGAWEQASSAQWRIVAVYFCRKIWWDGERLQVVLFQRRLVDPLVMNPQQHPVDGALWPVHPLPPGHPAHRTQPTNPCRLASSRSR